MNSRNKLITARPNENRQAIRRHDSYGSGRTSKNRICANDPCRLARICLYDISSVLLSTIEKILRQISFPCHSKRVGNIGNKA